MTTPISKLCDYFESIHYWSHEKFKLEAQKRFGLIIKGGDPENTFKYAFMLVYYVKNKIGFSSKCLREITQILGDKITKQLIERSAQNGTR